MKFALLLSVVKQEYGCLLVVKNTTRKWQQ